MRRRGDTEDYSAVPLRQPNNNRYQPKKHPLIKLHLIGENWKFSNFFLRWKLEEHQADFCVSEPRQDREMQTIRPLHGWILLPKLTVSLLFSIINMHLLGVGAQHCWPYRVNHNRPDFFFFRPDFLTSHEAVSHFINIAPLGKNLTLCQRQYQEYWKYPAMGRYVPRCKPDGSFDNIQCRGAYCFCVDQNGNRRPGSIMLLSVASSVIGADCPDSGKRENFVHWVYYTRTNWTK